MESFDCANSSSFRDSNRDADNCYAITDSICGAIACPYGSADRCP